MPHHRPEGLRHWGSQALAYLWAAPCSLVGACLGLAVLAGGGHARWVGGVWEVSCSDARWQRSARLRAFPYRAITLGHVVVASNPHDMHRLRRHERAHVAQYARWGLLFFVAYPLASLWLWGRGQRAYWDNPFEVQARRAERRRLGRPSAPGQSRASGP